MATASGAATGPLALIVDAANPGHAVSPDLFGVFFEEINYAGVGGLYPELVRNRSFMDPVTPAQWVAATAIPGCRANSAAHCSSTAAAPPTMCSCPRASSQA